MKDRQLFENEINKECKITDADDELEEINL